MASTSIPTPTKIGALYDAAEKLKDDASSLFASYEGDEDVGTMIELANDLGARAYRIAAALSRIAVALSSVSEGLTQL
jgi:hypothetical protein